MGSPDKPIITTAADPTVLRIVPELAEEIGLNESIALLQLSHWIKNAQNLRDGKWWTYQSVREMKEKAFKFWGIGTISRVIKSLETKGLIFVGNYNKRKGDKTAWYALNPEGLATLKSIQVAWLDPETGVFQNGTLRSKMEQAPAEAFQNGTTAFQNGTTLPEITPEIPQTEKPAEDTHPPDINPDFARVTTAYEKNIGMLTPMIASTLKDVLTEVPVAWVLDAIQLAVENNKRNWRYCDAILRRWQRDGKDDGRTKKEVAYHTMSPAVPAENQAPAAKGEVLEETLRKTAEELGITLPGMAGEGRSA